jgi:hypothetical protein
MKTIVKILFVVAVLWSLAFIFKLGNSFAASNNACSSDNWSWSIETVKWADGTPTDEKTANFKYNNKTSMVAKIKGVKLLTKSGKLVHQRTFKSRKDYKTPNPTYVKPFSDSWNTLTLNKDIPWQIISKASIICETITVDQYENELLAAYKNEESGNVKNDFDELQTELYQGCYENTDQLTDQRAKEYCRCVTLMITDKYEDTQILEIGEKSEAYQRSRFAFAGKYCNLNARARGDK